LPSTRFHAGVVGRPVVGRDVGRPVFFRVGPASMLLVFDPATALRAGAFPPRGATPMDVLFRDA
jgi:hypothetical protein